MPEPKTNRRFRVELGLELVDSGRNRFQFSIRIRVGLGLEFIQRVGIGLRFGYPWTALASSNQFNDEF